MPTVPRAEPFLKLRFLDGLSEADRQVILAAGSQRRLYANSVVVNQEDPAERLFLLTKGRARYFYITEDGRKILLHWLMPGDIFGGAALLSGPFHFLVSTELLRDSVLVVWNRGTIRNLAAQYPRLLDNALAIAVTDYLAWYVAAHAALTCNNARERLAHVLVSLARGIGHQTPDGIELEVTNEELGDAANVSQFTASRLLSSWQRDGALSRGRGRLVLHYPERLFGGIQ